MNTITVVSLGLSPEGLTLGALEAMKTAQQLILRTARTPVSAYLDQQQLVYISLDHLYDEAEDFDTLNGLLTDAVLEAAETAPVTYAVLDAQWDESVHILLEKAQKNVCVLPGVGMFDRLRILHPEARICAADGLPDQLGDEELLIVEIDSALLAGQIKLRMIDWFGADCPCIWYAPEENGQHKGKRIVLQDLDRQHRYAHNAAVYIAPQPMMEKERYTVHDLVKIMQILRAPGGCPWDREQTHESLRPYLIEEAYEVTQAIRDEDWLHTADELGDVLLQVVYQANIGEQYGTLELSDITTAICRKMIRRHPHIFGHVSADTPEDVTRNWEAIKREERGQKNLSEVLKDIPASLPPLMRAQKVQNKSEKVCTDLSDRQSVLCRIADAIEQVQNGSDAKRALGDLLFACVNLARICGVDSEVALADVTDAFIQQIDKMDCQAENTSKKQL